MKMTTNVLLVLIATLSITTSCRDNKTTEEISIDIETTDWSETSHSNSVEPDFSTVFNQNEVLRFDITIEAEDWTTMQEDLETNMGSSGGPGGPGGGGSFTDFDPVWVPCSFKFEDTEWYKVGIRYKGNSSLNFVYQSGGDKFSLKLDFDEFEDTYPAISDQRFYGFKQLNLNNNYDDNSALREKVGADLFRDFGLPAANTSFCAVYLDYGNGSKFMGLYTLVEEVDDTVIEKQFDDGNGNLYKPDGNAASFALGTYSAEEMEKKTNEEEADYSDVIALYDVLNNDSRITNTTQWKSDLNEVFDVQHFLKWLAVNTAIQNWDTYGNLTHNYYLYNVNNKLTWIPWDNNEALQEGKMGGALSLLLNEVNDSWPLIRYIIDEDEYRNDYDNYLKEFTENVFETSRMNSLYSEYYSLIEEYAQEEIGSSFSSSVEQLKQHVQDRHIAIEDYL